MTKFALLLLASSILLSNCVKKRDLSINTVIRRVNAFPDGLHPTNSSSGVSSFIKYLTQKQLIATNLQTEKKEALLIESLPTVDSTGLLYRFKLKPGIYWDNGQELTVTDVFFSAKAWLCPLTNNPLSRPIYTSIIDSLYPSEDSSLEFFMKTKITHVSNSTILEEMVLMQKSHWDTANVMEQLSFQNIHSPNFKSSPQLDNWFNTFNDSKNAYVPENIVGLGPYQVEFIKKDNFISLVKKENWWGDTIKGRHFDNEPDRIIFKIITDDAATFLAIKNQEIDFNTERGGISKLLKLQKKESFNKNYNSDFIPTYGYTYMGLNMRPNESTQIPFFTSKKVRKAIAYAIPVDEIIEVIKYKQSTRLASVTPPLKQSCNTDLKIIPYDVQTAKKLLKEAGWEDTNHDQILDKEINGKREKFSFKLNYITRGNNKEIVFMMKESLLKVGIELISNPLDFNTHYSNAGKHEFDAMIGVWSMPSGYSDPSQLWSSENWSNKGANFCGFGNAESDSLIVKSNTTLDPTLHLKYYQAFQKLIYEEQPYVFLWSDKLSSVSHKRFKNAFFYSAAPNTSLGSYMIQL